MSTTKKNVVPIRSDKGAAEHFYRIIELPLKEGDTFRGYQTERIDILDGRITSRVVIDKPNLFEFAQSQMLDLMDPRNQFTPADPNDFA